jgi:hypothetical protein
MARAKLMACCVWLLGSAVAVTGLITGPDHWGSYQRFLRGGPAAELPVDAAIDSWVRSESSSDASVSSAEIPADDYAGDEPDEPVGDRLILWLCDDGGGQKQLGLPISPGDTHWSALIANPSGGPRTDDDIPSVLSLSSLHVRLQI